MPVYRVSHSGRAWRGGGGGGPPPAPPPTPPSHPKLFFKNPPSNLMPPWGVTSPHLKMKPPIWETNSKLKSEAPFQEMIPRKKPQIIDIFNHKTTLEKDGRNSTRMWFYHLEQSRFCGKWNSFFKILYYLVNHTIGCNQQCTVNSVIL